MTSLINEDSFKIGKYKKRGITGATKSRLVIFWRLIGLGITIFRPITDRSKAKPKQSQITFDIQLIIALFVGDEMWLKLECVEYIKTLGYRFFEAEN